MPRSIEKPAVGSQKKVAAAGGMLTLHPIFNEWVGARSVTRGISAGQRVFK